MSCQYYIPLIILHLYPHFTYLDVYPFKSLNIMHNQYQGGHDNCFSTNQLCLHQGPQSMVVLDPALFALHVNQISTLPMPHKLVKTISKVTIHSGTLAVGPTTFNRTPKPNCYYNFTEMSHMSQQNLFVVPVLKIYGTKLPVHLLCTIINTSPSDVILPQKQHISEMKLLSNSDDSHSDIQFPQTNSYPSTSCKIYSNS